jgi:protease I
MAQNLNGKRVAILATDGVEQEELFEPRKALQQAGARAEVIALKPGNIKGWNHTQWGEQIPVDKTIDQAKATDYDALMLPGGVMNPDQLRQDRRAVQFVKSFFDTSKPIAALCHGPSMLVEAGVLRGRQLTSAPALQTDIRNAGGNWIDQQVVVDHGLITSRKPEDMPAFNRKMVEEIAGARAPV